MIINPVIHDSFRNLANSAVFKMDFTTFFAKIRFPTSKQNYFSQVLDDRWGILHHVFFTHQGWSRGAQKGSPKKIGQERGTSNFPRPTTGPKEAGGTGQVYPPPERIQRPKKKPGIKTLNICANHPTCSEPFYLCLISSLKTSV